MKKRDVTDIDRLVGINIRRVRIERDMSQQQLAAAAGVSFQQIQKYEKGINRVTVGRLLAIGDALKIRPERLWRED